MGRPQILHFLCDHVFSLAILLRVLLLAYAAWHDAAFPIRYPDVDYDVFTGAAALVARGARAKTCTSAAAAEAAARGRRAWKSAAAL